MKRRARGAALRHDGGNAEETAHARDALHRRVGGAGQLKQQRSNNFVVWAAGRPEPTRPPMCQYINTRNTDPAPPLSTGAQRRHRATNNKYNVMYYVNNTLERRTAETAIRRRERQRAAAAGKGGAGRAFEPRDAGVWPKYGDKQRDAGVRRRAPACARTPQYAPVRAGVQSVRRHARASDGMRRRATACGGARRAQRRATA